MKNNEENDFTGLKETLYAFVPLRLLRETGFDEKMGVDLLGEKKEGVMAYMCGGVELKNSTDADKGEYFDSINRMLSYALPAIVKNQGAIEDFKKETFRALFRAHAEDALTAAISMCESFTREAETINRNLAIALTYGMVSLGVVGYQYRMSVVSLSPISNLATLLQERAVTYSARILVTGTLADEIPGFETRYNHRLLGKIFLRETGTEERLYDVFDGDEIAIRNLKRKTKTLFERGVALYLERRFQEARGCFIEVLKVDRSDKASRNYLFLCDNNYNMAPAERETVKVWLEEF